MDYETRIKKFYSAWINAIDMSVAENGPIETWTYPEGTPNNYERDYEIVNTYILPYLNIVSKNKNQPNNWQVKRTNGNNDIYDYSQYCLKDGMCFSVFDMRYDGRTVRAMRSNELYSAFNTGVIMAVTVDLNGPKGPNIAGIDALFLGSVHKDLNTGAYVTTAFKSQVPLTDSQIQTKKNNCKNNTDIHDCAYFIIKNGFKYPDFYPIKIK